MPTYAYKREDGTTFEVMQRITDEALEVCPTTGQKVKRVINGGAGLIFKGSGFYLTDYAKKNSPPGPTPSNSESSSSDSSGASETSAATKDTSSPAPTTSTDSTE